MTARPDNRRFWTLKPGNPGQKLITGREAMARYPNPAFFMRPSERQSLDEIREILRRNCDEAERVVYMMRSWTRFQKKSPIIEMANKLHDFRVSICIHGGECGRPYLWEE
jgi:hypothetical protein